MLFRILIFLLASQPLHAQYFDLGLSGGVCRYNGDLNPGPALGLGSYFGGHIRFNVNKWCGASLSINVGSIKGDDKESDNFFENNRNLNFKSSAVEIALIGNFNLLPYVPDSENRRFSPYVFAGVGLGMSDPSTEYQGQTYSLLRLGTEGQGLREYQGYQGPEFLSFPLGVGLKIAINPKVNIGFEASYRFTNSDYLDDVSGKYPDADLLMATKGALTTALSDRSTELTGIAVNRGGEQRGDGSPTDSFMSLSLFVSYNFYETFPFTPKRKVKKKAEPGEWF